MKFLWGVKDGGPKSRVWVWGIESKRFGSLLLLLFRQGSREAYHTHAFNCISLVLSGSLCEVMRSGQEWRHMAGSIVRTYRSTFHKVKGVHERNWVLTVRGPWIDHWIDSADGKRNTLTHGRKVIESVPEDTQ